MFFLVFAFQGFAEAKSGTLIKEKQVVEINKSLKNVIEENQRLVDKNRELESEVKKLRTENSSGKERFEGLQRDRDELANQVREVRSNNRKYSKDIRKTRIRN